MNSFFTRCKKLSTFCLGLLSFSTITAQQPLPEFGKVTYDELNLKECSFDKNADAVILLNDGVANFNEEHNLITERRIRLKILKEKGLQRANVRIPFYSDGDFEYIRAISGVVITPNADGTSYTTTQLESKNIFTRKVNRLYSVVSFALPNVKVGSIIEYAYRSVMKHYGGLRRWEFQTDIPVVTSSYELAPLVNSEFAYSVYKNPDFPIQITPDKANGKIRFVMNNVPGLRDEVFAASTESFLQRVNFQFASYTSHIGKTNYTNTWETLARELLDERAFGSQINKDLSGNAFLKSLPATLSITEKIKAIHDFVRRNISWDNIISKYSESGVKDALEKKKGNSGDINLLLVSLLKSAGLDACPVLVSERENGLIDTSYSYLQQFNKVVAYVNDNGKCYVLDGTDMDTPFFLVPADLLNTIGFLVDKKKYRFVYFNNLPNRQAEHINLLETVQEDGAVTGSAVVSNMEYAKLEKESRFKNDQARHREDVLKPYSFLTVDSFAVQGLNNDSASLKYLINFHYNLKKTGGYYLLSPNLFTGFTENPFVTQYRFTDIDFATRYDGVVTASIVLPASFTVETLPNNKKMVSPDHSMSVSRFLQKDGDRIGIRLNISIARERFAADEYEMVKVFFNEMIDFLNEPILLKSK